MTQVYFMNPEIVKEDARRQLAAMFREVETHDVLGAEDEKSDTDFRETQEEYNLHS